MHKVNEGTQAHNYRNADDNKRLQTPHPHSYNKCQILYHIKLQKKFTFYCSIAR